MGAWLPKSVLCLKEYTPRLFMADLLAGITVGLVALPLAMAFAIASGMSPQTGLYCAIVAGFVVSALGGSSTQIGGPTGAFVVVVFGIVSRFGVDGLFMCTLLAGIILLVLGATGLGTAVKFIPRPVVVGFTNGIAVIIASTQIRDFFGLRMDKVPGDFASRILALAHNSSSFSWAETTLASGALIVIIFFMVFVKRVPGHRCDGGSCCFQTPSCNDWHPVWWHSIRVPNPDNSTLSLRPPPSASLSSDHHCDVRSN
jgi:SulP family sulfate permease